jgi:Family of unknown function (DUF6535)
VNALFFMSLSLNLFAAMMATLLQRWTRQYLMLTHSPLSNSDYRARLREVFGNDLQDSPIILALRASMISMIYSALFFFVGLAFYLSSFNISVSIGFYICSTFCFFRYVRIRKRKRALHIPFYTAINPLRIMPEKPPVWKPTDLTTIDGRVLDRLFMAVTEDSDLVRFFERIPGFCKSSLVDDPQGKIINLWKAKLDMAAEKLMERTWSLNSLSDSEKSRRVVACVKVADAVRLPDVGLSILKVIFPWDQYQILQSVQIGLSLRAQGNASGTQQKFGLCAQSFVAGIISNAQPGDQRWIALAADQLGKSEDVILGYLEHGHENLLLANLIHIIRQIFKSSSGDDQDQDMADASSFILPTLSNFDIRNTFLGLQHDFRVLWDEIDREAPNNRVIRKIRDELGNLHDALSQGAYLPLASEVQHDPLGRPYHVDHNTGTATQPWTRPFNPTPYIAPYTPAPNSVTTDRAHDVSLEGMQPPTAVTVIGSSHLTAEPLESDNHSNISQAVFSASTATVGNVVDTPSRELPSDQPDCSSVPPANAQSPTTFSVDTSDTSPATPQVASIFRSDVLGTAPHHDAQKLNDSIEMESLDHTPQPGPSVADYRTPLSNSA